MTVIQSVCEAHGVTVDDILSGGRRFYRPRHEVFARLRKEIVMQNGRPPSYPLIGRWTGHDHTSVIYGEKMHHERKKKVWTEELAAKAAAMKKAGATDEEIAKEVGKTKNAVSIFLSRTKGVARKGRRSGVLTEKEINYAVAERDKGKSFVAIGKELHRDPGTVAKVLREKGYGNLIRSYTKEEDATITEMYRAGRTAKQIAAAIGGGVGVVAIRGRICVLGLPKARAERAPRKRKPDPMTKNLTPRESGSWDSRTFLPYNEWRAWKQEQRKMMEQERAA